MSEINSQSFAAYGRRCGIIFLVVVCATLVMVASSYAPLQNRHLTIAMVLAGACFNAFMVAGYLMHLVTERRMIFAVLAFTVFFFVGLMGLTIWASYDHPHILKA